MQKVIIYAVGYYSVYSKCVLLPRLEPDNLWANSSHAEGPVRHDPTDRATAPVPGLYLLFWSGGSFCCSDVIRWLIHLVGQLHVR